MELTFIFDDNLDPVAVYAAIVATTVLAWDMVKWLRSGARLVIHIAPDMTVMGDSEREGITYILVTATNVGSAPTTVTILALEHYRNFLTRMRGKRDFSAFITRPQVTQHLPLPHVLKPGEEWSGLITQEKEVIEKSKDGLLYAAIYHSIGRKPVRGRIRISEAEKDK